MEQECCPRFNSKKWDKKTFIWRNKKFIKETIPTFFHIPFPPMIGSRIAKMCKLIEKSKAKFQKKEDVLVLFRDTSAFKSEIYISVIGKILNANNVNISGKFMTKTFDGEYNAVPKFVKHMNKYLKEKGKKIPKHSDYYIHYAYCPKCAKKYGHNAMILFARIK